MSSILTEYASIIQYADDTTLYFSKFSTDYTCAVLFIKLSQIKKRKLFTGKS